MRGIRNQKGEKCKIRKGQEAARCEVPGLFLRAGRRGRLSGDRVGRRDRPRFSCSGAGSARVPDGGGKNTPPASARLSSLSLSRRSLSDRTPQCGKSPGALAGASTSQLRCWLAAFVPLQWPGQNECAKTLQPSHTFLQTGEKKPAIRRGIRVACVPGAKPRQPSSRCHQKRKRFFPLGASGTSDDVTLSNDWPDER